MVRFLIGTVPVVGHVTPALPIATQLIERGHEVWWYSGKAFQSLIEQTGAHFVPISSGLDYSEPDNVPQSWVEQRRALRGVAQLKFDLQHFFIDAVPGQVKDLATILKDFQQTLCWAIVSSWVRPGCMSKRVFPGQSLAFPLWASAVGILLLLD